MALAADTAPFIYFEGVVGFGINNGVIQLEVAANVATPTDRAVIVTGHLRCTLPAAMALRQSIDRAVELLKNTSQAAAVDQGQLN
jgi:hypothetical protein